MAPPTSPKIDARLVIEPAAAGRPAPAALRGKQGRSRSGSRSRPAATPTSAGVGSRRSGRTPAEFTKVVSRPNRARVSSTIRAHAASSVTSAASAIASPPPAAIVLRRLPRRPRAAASTHATCAPSAREAQRRRAADPEPAPVTSATFVFIRIGGILSWSHPVSPGFYPAALFLDRRSERLTGFSAAERNRAAAWFAQNNPFAGTHRKLQTAAHTAPASPRPNRRVSARLRVYNTRAVLRQPRLRTADRMPRESVTRHNALDPDTD